jgi:polar amino acid transport system substrate-binding protein
LDTGTFIRRHLARIAASIWVAGVSIGTGAQTAPAPGASPRVDAIRKAGVLRVGVVNNAPWLVENTSGQGEPWEGPSWLLAQEYARLLSVKLQPILVSHETKVPALTANQFDIMIGPLAESAERQKIIDFVTFSNTSVCMFGLASNPKFTKAQSVEDFNKPDVTIAYFTGAGEEPWVRKRFPNAKQRGVANSGSPAPIEEVLAGRSDVAPLNRVLWMTLSKKVKGLAVFPKENDCQDSKEYANPLGMGVEKNQPVFLDWLRAVESRMKPALLAEEQRATRNLK